MEHENAPLPSNASHPHDKHNEPSSPQVHTSPLATLHPSLPLLLRTITAHKPPRTTLRLLIPILTAHILRVFYPSLFFYYPHALTDMKLAKSSPHYYLLSSVTDFTYPGFAVFALYALGLKKLRGMAWEGMVRDKSGDGWCILHLTLGIVCLEGAFVQTCWTASQLWAYYQLFSGGQAEKEFLEGFLKVWNWRVMALLGLVVEWVVHGVLPEVRDVIRDRRWVAGAAYGGMVVGTGYAVRYSNKYFVVLEMVDVWLLGVKLLLAVGVVGWQTLVGSTQREGPKKRVA